MLRKKESWQRTRHFTSAYSSRFIDQDNTLIISFGLIWITPGLLPFSKLPNSFSIFRALAPLMVAQRSISSNGMSAKFFRIELISSQMLRLQLLARLSVPKTIVQSFFLNNSIGGSTSSMYLLALTQRQKKV